MKHKILSIMNTTKKKAGIALVCGILVSAVGAGAVFANPITSLLVKMENGVRNYSTDGGKTWSEQVPQGVTVGEDGNGKVKITHRLPLKDGQRKNLLVKMENGVRSYSTDGGKTWSEQAPEGVRVSEDETGRVKIIHRLPAKDGQGKGLLVRMENGVRSYSADGGKTWSEQAPEGVTVNLKTKQENR